MTWPVVNPASKNPSNSVEKPLNLVMKAQQKPLNLTKPSADSKVALDSSNSEVGSSNACEKKKAIKKIFTKISSKSGFGQWKLKKKKCNRKSMQSRSKFNLQESLNKKRLRKVKASQPSGKENSCTESVNDTSNLSKRPQETSKDTKIKLIKVGDSYKIASNNEGSHEESDDDNLIIDESFQKGQEESCRNTNKQQIDQTVKEKKAAKAFATTTPSTASVAVTNNGNTRVKPSPLHPVQLVTVTKGKVQDGVTVECKPIWIQIPTSSGGVKVFPLVVPPNKQQIVTSSRQSHVKQIKCQTKSLSNYRDKSGFPKVTESNKRRKVFKIGEDGSISCLGTLEEVQKSGLLSNVPVPHEPADKQADANIVQPPSNVQLKKTERNADVKSTKPSIRVEGTSGQKRKAIKNLGALDLTVKTKRFKEQAFQRGTQPITVKHNDINEISQAVINNKQSLATFREICSKPTLCGRSVISNDKLSRKSKVEENAPTEHVMKSLLVPQQQYGNSDQNHIIVLEVPSNAGGCPPKENAENLFAGGNTGKRHGRSRIRSEIKSKIKESYFAPEKKDNAADREKRDFQTPIPENMRPKWTFQAPRYPLYTIPTDQRSNRAQVPSLYYPVQLRTGHSYQGNLFMYCSVVYKLILFIAYQLLILLIDILQFRDFVFKTQRLFRTTISKQYHITRQ